MASVRSQVGDRLALFVRLVVLRKNLGVDFDELIHEVVGVVEETSLQPLGYGGSRVVEAERLEQSVHARRLHGAAELGDESQRRLQLPFDALVDALVFLGARNHVSFVFDDVFWGEEKQVDSYHSHSVDQLNQSPLAFLFDVGRDELVQEAKVLGAERQQNVVVEIGLELELDLVW